MRKFYLQTGGVYTREYYSASGGWVTLPVDALSFSSLKLATDKKVELFGLDNDVTVVSLDPDAPTRKVH